MASPPAPRSQTQGKKRAVSVLVSSSTQEAVESAFKDGSERESWLQFAIQHSKGVYRTASNGNGIKNKIYRLQAAFKAAHTLRSSSGFGSTESESWKAAIESERSCYFELLPVWGRKWSNGVVRYADSTTDLKDDFITDDPPRKDIDSDTGAEAEEEDQEGKDESEYHASLNWEDESDCNGDFDSVDGTWSQEEEDEPLRAADGDPSSSTRMPKKPKSSKREVTDDIKELIKAIRVSALLEYQKAEIQERVRMKEIESRLKEKELDFKLRLAEIEARKAEAIAKVQAGMEIAFQRERLMSERESDVPISTSIQLTSTSAQLASTSAQLATTQDTDG
ncbi:hypothetical protein KI688_007569 [Linnemannia hyalina]|uniref:Uncharacterized protein n=1 Tax=Linnemannia hyalina TaxID=64524 RepID=A0A9P7XKN7_9FUNG|nr:hypothetical protein KI688_007569 [Linnemannia hyalina]